MPHQECIAGSSIVEGIKREYVDFIKRHNGYAPNLLVISYNAYRVLWDELKFPGGARVSLFMGMEIIETSDVKLFRVALAS